MSCPARPDVEQIARTSLQGWGLARAEADVLNLHDTFQRLAAFPDLGRDAGDIRPGLLRFESASHAIFYRVSDHGIIIILRILHDRIEGRRHL
jgi:toxin ParE1/3/4